MAGLFEFIGDLPGYRDKRDPAGRLNMRRRMIVEPVADEIRGARVLDLAAHDGRWSYAFAAAGAAEVVGVEGRSELIARFSAFPDVGLREKVELRHNDLWEELEAEVARGARYDVVAVLGILYHLMDHFRLFDLIRRLSPRLILVDSEFLTAPGPIIRLVRERTDNPLNAIPQRPGQEVAVKAIPSRAAIEMMAEALGYAVDWVAWDALPDAERGPVGDYFTTGRMRRGTCRLRPR